MTTSSTSTSSTSTSSPAINAAAVKFARDIITNRKLAKAYYDKLAQASKHKTYETEIIDNFLESKGYVCTLLQVINAQKQLGQYHLYYWNGAYSTKTSTKSSASVDGPVFTIHGAAGGAQQVGVGDMFIIEPQFSNLILSWKTDDGLNATTASVVFRTVSKDGKAYKSFAGTYTDDNGDQVDIVGIPILPKKLEAAVRQGKASIPPGQNMEGLQIAQMVLHFVGQLLNMGIMFYMIHKMGKEIAGLKDSIAKGEEGGPGRAEQEQELEDNNEEREHLEDQNDDVVQEGGDAANDVEQIPEGSYTKMGDAILGHAGDDELVEFNLDAPKMSSSAEDLFNDAVHDQQEHEDEEEHEDEDEDEEDEGEEETETETGTEGEEEAEMGMEDGLDVLEDIPL
ncbi:MAG: hypothetical protein K0V04_14760 [Deltaproteobacteria bacterium]|nr:hypothetical protein [Deltaproteobacteria bacterium]